MAVFVRAPELYHTLLETALSRAGVPAYFARGTRRPDPSGRALLALLACAAEGLSARRFAEYLSFAQLPRLTGGGPPPVAERRFVPPEDVPGVLPWTDEPTYKPEHQARVDELYATANRVDFAFH